MDDKSSIAKIFMKDEIQMIKTKAIRTAAMAACVSLFGGMVDSAVAATKSLTLNPFTLKSVSVGPTVNIVAPVIFVPVAAAAASPMMGPPTPPKGNPTAGPPSGSPPSPPPFSGGGSPPPPPPRRR
jgi:hypothetical protein